MADAADHGSYWVNHYYRARNYINTLLSSPHEFTQSDIIMLGTRYQPKNAKAFYQAWLEVIWCSYRRQFAALKPSSYVTDAGWGCMLRSAQMIMAQALMKHHRYTKKDSGYWKVIQQVMDNSAPSSVFSLQHMLTYRSVFGKKIGDWFGPNEVCYILKECLKASSEANNLCVCVSEDGTLYKDRIIAKCTGVDTPRRHVSRKGSSDSPRTSNASDIGLSSMSSSGDAKSTSTKANHVADLYKDLFSFDDGQPEDGDEPAEPAPSTEGKSIEKDVLGYAPSERWRAVVILIPVMLGVGEINKDYLDPLLKCLRVPASLGIIGGKPRASLYFVACQDTKLLYFDPHTVQDYADQKEGAPLTGEAAASYQCKSINSVDASMIDPSLSFGFYCRTRAEFERFWAAGSKLSAGKYPPFHLAEHAVHYDDVDGSDDDFGQAPEDSKTTEKELHKVASTRSNSKTKTKKKKKKRKTVQGMLMKDMVDSGFVIV